MNKLKEYKNIVITCLFFISIILIAFIYILYNKNDVIISDNIEITKEETREKVTESVKNNFYIDIKGQVKKPGVYLVEEGAIVNDAIKLAGGLTSAATTQNINLSQKLTNEMVIYVFSKKELTTTKTTTTCITNVIDVTTPIIKEETTPTQENVNALININTASKEELMSLSGIGDAKADAIIVYRNKTKFNSIDEIKNVSGIGESQFAKIKDNITV